MVPLAACVAALASACEDTRVLDVRLVLPTGLVLTEVVEELTIRVIDGETEQVVAEATVATERVGGEDDLLDLGDLQNGHSYVVTISAPVADGSDACQVRGRVVGLSAPFVHRESSSTVAVQLGCADELVPTRGAPLRARLAHRVVTDGEGNAVIVGGGRTLTVRSGVGEDWVYEDMVRTIERYDPTTGSFSEGGDLRETRAFPAALRLEGGEVAVIGGNQTLDPVCWDATEAISPTAIEPRNLLAQPRCFPEAVALDGAVVVLGGAVLQPENGAEVLDASLGIRLIDSVSGSPFRVRPAVHTLSDGTSAVVAGGSDTEPVVQILRLDDGGVASFEDVSGNVPPPTWGGGSAYVPCEEGGGAVYLVGGLDQGLETPEAWCYLDRPGGGSVVEAGELDTERANHVMLAVRGPANDHRLLVIGGSGGTDVHFDALLIEVDGCGCGPLGETTIIPLPEGFIPLHHAATVLDDGSVLIVGGTQLVEESGGDVFFHGAASSALFIPNGAL